MSLLQNKEFHRGAGVLMPISALPSPYGIGTLGRAAYRFVDFLGQISCRYWQVLPVGPTSYGDSPYQSFSAFAGNPYFIDLDCLVKEKLLHKEEIKDLDWLEKEDRVDYARIYKLRFQILRKAFERSNHTSSDKFQAFKQNNSYWLKDYSLFMAVKNHFNHVEWQLWEDDIKYRRQEALEYYRTLLSEDIHFWEFCQYKFHEQWKKLKAYANRRGIEIIGDMPLYVAGDSADVWVHSELFELDENRNPVSVAGVPPDAFSDEGQRWGNPLYRWDVMEQQDFSWWRERMKASSGLFDIIRIDHFIGIVNYFSIPAEAKSAKEGEWKTGPGKKLTKVINESIGNAKIIAEDLGIITPKVRALIDDNGYPSMKVLGFGLEGPGNHEYLPHNYKSTNLVAYTGTHDNDTLVGYLKGKTEEELSFPYRYFNVTNREKLPYAIIREMYSSIANIVIVPMQDLLMLGNEARMNLPSTIGGNWQWRLLRHQYKKIDKEILKEYARLYARDAKE